MNRGTTFQQGTESDPIAPIEQAGTRIGVMTSGGDSQGMNAAVRAIVRATLQAGGVPFAIKDGWRGAVDGGDGVKEMHWGSVGNILQRGGTVIGTARCPEFRELTGRRAAAHHLLEHGIDRLIIVGGDGSLMGAEELREEWPEHVAELLADDLISAETAQQHPTLRVIGLVGTIDNDLVGTDTTIGCDTALHRITDSLDALTSTAAAHQRCFVVEVMGRHCGYLALYAALAGGCDEVFVPEYPPAPGWAKPLGESLKRGHEHGRRQSLVVVAEGAVDTEGTPITVQDVSEAIADEMGEDPRVTILGHVQRGGTSSAYDRWMSTVLGVEAVERMMSPEDTESVILGTSVGTVVELPSTETVQATRAVAKHMKAQDFEAAAAARGPSFTVAWRNFADLSTPPAEPANGNGGKRLRLAVMHAGGLAPGMNPAVWAAARKASSLGIDIVGVKGSFAGLAAGQVSSLEWGDVEGWVPEGGALLGTSRKLPTASDAPNMARALADHDISGLLVVGGIRAYHGIRALREFAESEPQLAIPTMLVPATIDNNIPGTVMSVGADSALNVIIAALDGLKQSASAHQRCFVTEVMGRYCGFLAALSGIATGAERVYLQEQELTLADLVADTTTMRTQFEQGKQLHLAIRAEDAHSDYTTDMLAQLFDAESGGAFDVRVCKLGHVQHGCAPSPYDRVLAINLATAGVAELVTQIEQGDTTALCVGLSESGVGVRTLESVTKLMDHDADRPLDQWWLPLVDVIKLMSAPNHEVTWPE